MRAIDGIETKS